MNETIAQQTFRFDWSKSEPLHAAMCLPAVVLPLILGAHYGYPGTGVLMAGGAMCVGFGSFQKPLVWRWGPMLAAAIGIAISGALGAMVHERILAFGALVVVWAFIYGLSNAMGPVAAWVGMQCCVYLIISAAAPRYLGGPRDIVLQGMARGAGLLAGGLLQMAIVLLAWRWVPRSTATFTDPHFDARALHPRTLLQAVGTRSDAFHFAVRIALTSLLAVIAFYFAGFNNAYWIPMTAILLPQMQLRDTAVKTVLRLIGTLFGAGLCTLLIVFVHPAGETLALLVTVFLFATYCLLYVNYGVFAIALTGYIVFILAMVRVPERATIAHRVEATLIGGAIALMMHALFHWIRVRKGFLPSGSSLPPQG